MKKLTAVLAALAMALSLFACGSLPEKPETPSPDVQQGTVILPKPDEGQEEPKGEYPAAGDPLPQQPDKKDPQQTAKPQDNKKPESNKPQETQKPPEAPKQEDDKNNGGTASGSTVSPGGEYRAVWISYLELGGMLTGKTARQFRSNIAAAYDNAKNLGCNTVIVHVRPFGDALYRSDYYPTSYLITGSEGDPLPFDPLKIMLEEAHNRGLTFDRQRRAGDRTQLRCGRHSL